MSIDENLFDTHINESWFQIGVDSGKWGIHSVDWPVAVIWVKAKPKINQPEKYYFRFELTNYPQQAPTACPWDINTKQKLEHNGWPKGAGFVSSVFNPGWNGGIALYAPCDRIAMAGHDQWKTQYPDLWWNSDMKITKYLVYIYTLLNSSDYEKS